jgi:peroxiredoxin
MSSPEPQLAVGKPAPNFTLPTADGRSVTRSAYRARKHLVVIFLPCVDLPAREYLEALRDRYGEVRDADAEILAVCTDPAAAADGLRAALDVPFPLLLDPEGTAARRYLPDGAAMGVFILDRYAALRAQWAVAAPPLPPAQEVVDWLYAIDRICTL